jgi:EamA domain-containing membrane protein RarD
MYGNLSIWIDSFSDNVLVAMLISAVILPILGGWLTQRHKAFAILSAIGVISFTGLIIYVADNTYQSLKMQGVFESAILPIIPIIALCIGVFLIASPLKYKAKANQKTKSNKSDPLEKEG